MLLARLEQADEKCKAVHLHLLLPVDEVPLDVEALDWVEEVGFAQRAHVGGDSVVGRFCLLGFEGAGDAVDGVLVAYITRKECADLLCPILKNCRICKFLRLLEPWDDPENENVRTVVNDANISRGLYSWASSGFAKLYVRRMGCHSHDYRLQEKAQLGPQWAKKCARFRAQSSRAASFIQSPTRQPQHRPLFLSCPNLLNRW